MLATMTEHQRLKMITYLICQHDCLPTFHLYHQLKFSDVLLAAFFSTQFAVLGIAHVGLNSLIH